MMIGPWACEALIRLKPAIPAQPSRIGKVIDNLHALALSLVTIREALAPDRA
jgi:hypothetical protein